MNTIFKPTPADVFGHDYIGAQILTTENVKAIYNLNYSMALGIIEMQHGTNDYVLISYINSGVVYEPKKYIIQYDFDDNDAKPYVNINDDKIYIDEFIRTDI